MIYLIDKGFRIKSPLYNLINQVKCPGMYDECLRLSCKVKGEVKVEVEDKVDADVNDSDNVNTNDNVNENDNDNVNVNGIDNVNQGTCLADDNVNDNDNFNVNDYVNQGNCFEGQGQRPFADMIMIMIIMRLSIIEVVILMVKNG